MRSSDELGGILRRMYEGAPEGEKVANIHLFGVKYASDIRDAGYSAGEIVRASGLRTSYQVEVNKGMNLAKYVLLCPASPDSHVSWPSPDGPTTSTLVQHALA